MVEVLNFVYDEPNIITQVRDYAKEKWVAEKRKHTFGEGVESMGGTIDTFDEGFKIAFINRCVGVSHEALGKAKVQDTKIVQQIFFGPSSSARATWSSHLRVPTRA